MVVKYCKFKGYWAALRDVLCLFSAEKGQRSVGRDPIPTCIRPYVPASKKQQGVANLDRVVVLP